ncbi:hypothetical protein BSP36_017 [Bacillus phage BSP36]|nr:hypothetical protein BSP36_017 [Bacillus phage BSP36]
MSVELNVYRVINTLYDDTTPEVLEDSQAVDALYAMVYMLNYILEGEPEYVDLHETARRKVDTLKRMVGIPEEEEEEEEE